MQNIDKSAITPDQIDRFVNNNLLNDEFWSVAFWLLAMQNDLQKLPTVYNASDCRDVGGSLTFPPLPLEKIGLLFLSSGTYEAAVVGGADKWRRLYDGTTYDPATNIP